MKKIIALFLGLTSILSFSQEKKTIKNLNHVLMNIVPHTASSWVLLKNKEEIKNVGSFKNIDFETKGFQLDPTGETFYQIAYRKNGKVLKVENLNALMTFVGKIDNADEAIIKAIVEGYFVDLEYKDLAASYTENSESYVLEIGKITSEKCPFEKRSFSLIMDKKTGDIMTVKENEKYTEVYLKDCKNNPHRFIPPKKKKEKEVISIYR